MTSTPALRDVLAQKLAALGSEETNTVLVSLGQSCLLLGQVQQSDLPADFSSSVAKVLGLIKEGNIEVQARKPRLFKELWVDVRSVHQSCAAEPTRDESVWYVMSCRALWACRRLMS